MNISKWLKKVILFKKYNKFIYYECLFFLNYILKKDISWILVNKNFYINKNKLNLLNMFLIRRLKGEPICYIINNCCFWNINIYIYPDIFIPRKETEIIIEYSINLIKKENILNILDLGTGSGVIAISLAKFYKFIKITGIDNNNLCILLSKYNANKLNIKNVFFYKSNWFSKIKKKFNLIISNPPYINKNNNCLINGDLRYESYFSLVSNKGLYEILKIINKSLFYLNNNGWLIIEHGYLININLIKDIFIKNFFFNVKSYKDYNKKSLFTVGQKINLIN